MRIGGVIMARRQTLKYLLREELASKKEAGYGRSKHNDKLKTEQEREKLHREGVAYKDRIREVNHMKDYIYVSTTFEVYSRHVGYFADWLAEEYGLKKISIEECKPYIQEYINHMERQDYSAYTINLALAAICKATDEKMIDYEHKQRSVAEITRGTGERKHDAFNNVMAKETLEANRLLGLRRSQLKNLRASDIREEQHGNRTIVVVETIGKGKKINHQIFYDEAEKEAVLKFREGKMPDERIFNQEEFKYDADYHHMRELRCKDVYNRVVEDMKQNPERRAFYQSEIHRLFNEAGKHCREDLDMPVYARKDNRQRLLDAGRPIEYDRTALMFCSVTVTSHWRSSVTFEHYVGK